jgi:glyoxylase-like metal-dependent hydrolase (beta-lactamase superfamily II)
MRLSSLSTAILVLSLGLLPAFSVASSPPDVRLHRVATTERAWSVNAFVLESPTGVVIVDSLFLDSDVRKLIAVVRDMGKPVAGILVTHPHGDHAGGLPELRRAFGAVPVYATSETARLVVPTFERLRRQAWVARTFGDDYPTEAFAPDHIVGADEIIELAGMRFRFIDLGVMESDNNAVIENLDSGAILTGDATVAHANYYVGESHSCLALQGLQRLGGLFAADRVVYSGHYGPMRLGPLVADNIAQIRWLRARMAEALSDPSNRTPDGSLSEAARKRLVTTVGTHFEANADYGFGPEGFAENANLGGLEKEMRDEAASGKACPH